MKGSRRGESSCPSNSGFPSVEEDDARAAATGIRWAQGRVSSGRIWAASTTRKVCSESAFAPDKQSALVQSAFSVEALQ